MNTNLRFVKSRLNNVGNFLVMIMVVALLLFAIYLARQNRRARLEYENRMFAADKKIKVLQHTIEKRDFLIRQLQEQLKQLKRQGSYQ